MLSKSNTVNKERNKIRKGAGAVSKKNNKKKSSKPKPSSNHTDDVSSLDGEDTVPESLYNGNDNDLDKEDKDGDTDDL